MSSLCIVQIYQLDCLKMVAQAHDFVKFSQYDGCQRAMIDLFHNHLKKRVISIKPGATTWPGATSKMLPELGGQ